MPTTEFERPASALAESSHYEKDDKQQDHQVDFLISSSSHLFPRSHLCDCPNTCCPEKEEDDLSTLLTGCFIQWGVMAFLVTITVARLTFLPGPEWCWCLIFTALLLIFACALLVGGHEHAKPHCESGEAVDSSDYSSLSSSSSSFTGLTYTNFRPWNSQWDSPIHSGSSYASTDSESDSNDSLELIFNRGFPIVQ